MVIRAASLKGGALPPSTKSRAGAAEQGGATETPQRHFVLCTLVCLLFVVVVVVFPLTFSPHFPTFPLSFLGLALGRRRNNGGG